MHEAMEYTQDTFLPALGVFNPKLSIRTGADTPYHLARRSLLAVGQPQRSQAKKER